ncbi:unnamed protein product [Calypogeia fissa]
MAEEKVSMSVALRGAQESLSKGQYQEVVKLCKIVLKQDRNNYDAYVLLGSALFQLKQYVPAEKALRLAVGVNASKMAAWQRLVELYETTDNSKDLVEVCQATRERAQALGRVDRYYEYTRKLVAAYSANLDYGQACSVWQEIVDSSSVSENFLSEAIRGLANAKSSLLEKLIQEEFKNRIGQHEKVSLSSSGQLNGETTLPTEDVLRSVEEEFVDHELSRELEMLLCKITSDSHTSEHYHELLLKLLVRRVRATRLTAGEDWRVAKFQALKQTVGMMLSHRTMTALEVAAKLLEDDDGEEMFRAIGIGPEIWKQRSQSVYVWVGRFFAHTYPGHGLALAALGYDMHCSPSRLSRLERTRQFCERALRIEDNCVTGWQVLAEVHVQQSSYSSAVECVRRGLQAVQKSRAMYGLSLRVSELRLLLTLGQTHLASQNFTEADATFQNVAEEAKLLGGKGMFLLAAASEGLAKVGLAQGEVEVARARLETVLSLNAQSHWALAEQGWLAFQNGNQEDAIKYLEQAVALQPTDASYHRRLGLVCWKGDGNAASTREKAFSQFLEAVKLDPSQPDVFRYLGHYYKDTTVDMQRAMRCYQKSISLDPEDEEAGEALCDLLDSGGQEVLELDICRGASERSRRAFWAWRRLGFLQVHRKEWTEAVPNLQHALRGYVTDSNLWEALGLAYQHLGMLTAALKAYGRVTTLGSHSPVFSLLQSGNILLLLASYAKAIDMFREALEKVPQHVGALCGLAAAMLGRARECMVMGAFSWSASLTKDAIEHLSGSLTSCSNVGAFWKLLGDLEVTYAQALPCEVTHVVNLSSFTLDANSLNRLRTAIEMWEETRLRSLKQATRFYQRALHLCPSQGSLHSDLGLAFDLISSIELNKTQTKSSWSRAMTAVCGGLRLGGDKPDLWVTLGMLTQHKGLRQHSFIQALRIDGTHALAWGGLGQLYIEEGQEDMARDAFDRARSANPALPIPWAGMAFIHSFLESEKDLQEAYASCLYAVQLSPTVEVQLGLAKLASRTNQLQAAEVYTAVEQAIQHAPHRAAAHNLRGLVCESRGDIEASIKAFLLAHYALSLPSNATRTSSSKEALAISLNLARVLCKIGAAGVAVHEYERLAELGLLQDDASGLRGYAVALWECGSTDKAISVAKKSAEIDLNLGNIVGGLSLVAKMVYHKFGPSYALEEIRNASVEALSNSRYFLSSLAVAVVCGHDSAIASLLRSHSSSFSHEILIKAHLLVAASKQLIPGQEDSKSAIRHLKKALHIYPQSVSLRARLGELLLESSAGDKASLVAQCCGLSPSVMQHNLHYGSLGSILAAVGYACALCGNIVSGKFSTCHGSFPHNDSLLRYLQSWVHTEPWNLKAHIHLVLSFLQKARAQDYPLNMCRALRRMATTALSMASTNADQDLSFHGDMRLFLLITISECALHIGDNTDAILTAKAAINLQLSPDEAAFAMLQLARCYAALLDHKSLQVELSKVRKVLTPENIQGWLSLIDLEMHCKVPESSSSLELCKAAILRSGLDEQMNYMARLHLVCANGFITADDLWAAQKAAAEASALLPENPIFHLLHGALCLELVLKGSNTELLGTAMKSLSKAMSGSGNGAIPLTSLLLCQAQSVKGSTTRTGDVSKWERKLWTEWLAWPSDCRPAELYFQMGVLAKKAQGTLLGIAGTTEISWSARSWLQRAVRLRPDFIPYWTALQEQ